MSYRHKTTEIINTTIDVGTGINGFKLVPFVIDHVGKLNHKIIVNFVVSQPNPNMVHDIKVYLMNEYQTVEWLLRCMNQNSWALLPTHYVHGTNQLNKGSFETNVSQSNHAYFLLDNRYSTVTGKQLTLVVKEEWDEQESPLSVVTTIPPHDRSLNTDVTRIIENSKTDLKIVSPYIDMLLIDELLKKHQQGVNIKIVTRAKDEFNGKDKKDTFEYLQKNLKSNHKTNKSIHSRMIISDEQEALVSSADLTYDSMIAQFNVGIVSSDTNVIRKLLEYFNIVWQKS